MSFKTEVLALAILCFSSVVMCDSDSHEGVDHLLRIPEVHGAAPAPRPKYAAPAPAPAPRPKYHAYGAPAPAPAPVRAASSSESHEAADLPAKYVFSYQLQAGAPVVVKKPSYGYGKASGSSEEVLPAVLSEFGHAETRDDDKTSGKYFVQLPDGRLQTVEYTVDGDSGFVAKVAYDGVSVESLAAASASSEEAAAPRPVIHRIY